MEDSKILLAIAVVAIMALIGRVIINRQAKTGINWPKIIRLFVAMAAFAIVYFSFEPHRFLQNIKGEASLADGHTECIAGRAAGPDIPQYSINDTTGLLYYFLDIAELSPTGYFRTKAPLERQAEVYREELVSESNPNETAQINRTTSSFPITKNPGDRENEYLGLYMARLQDGETKILVALDEKDANLGISPIVMRRPTNTKIASIIQENDSTVNSEFYLVGFDEQKYGRLYPMTYALYRGIAGLIAAIVVILIVGFSGRKKK